jgi:hypothetical protein
MTERLVLARTLGFVAADLEARGYHGHGVVRQAARHMLEVPDDQDDAGCAGCRAELTQPPTGRRRKWCSEACRSRARRR